jgi:hypothetical protein
MDFGFDTFSIPEKTPVFYYLGCGRQPALCNTRIYQTLTRVRLRGVLDNIYDNLKLS